MYKDVFDFLYLTTAKKKKKKWDNKQTLNKGTEGNAQREKREQENKYKQKNKIQF
jgi:hypothetical protein